MDPAHAALRAKSVNDLLDGLVTVAVEARATSHGLSQGPGRPACLIRPTLAH